MNAGRWAWRPMRTWRLSSRMVLHSLLLLLLVQAVGFVAIRGSIERNARATLSEELRVGERVWTRLLDQRATKLGQGAALLAADFGFREAVASKDEATIASALENHGARINASMVALLGTDFAVRGQSPAGAGMHPLQLGTAPVAELAENLARKGSVVAVVRGQPHQFVMVPMRAPVLVGWVLMGFELDRSLADDLKAVTSLRASLIVQRSGTGSALLHNGLDTETARAALLSLTPGEGELRVDGQQLLTRTLPVSADSGSDRLMVSLSGSLAQALAPYQALQLALGALTLLGLALFGVSSIWVARRVTEPLRDLAEASERLERGDYDTPVLHTAREDELGDLAKAFEHMRGSIGQQQREIRQLAYWDRLTGLPNRIQFRETVQAATRFGKPLAVLMLDLDRFKHVNDVLGYATGDRLLQGVAERLVSAVRPNDLVARLGGDEFALMLPLADAAQAQRLAERITAAFEDPLTLDDQHVDLSAGLGIACFPEHAVDADILISRAEVAMVAAKRQTSGAQLYDASLDSGSEQTLSLLSELRSAVEHHQLRLYLQPKVALADRQLCGAEALVRWQHPTRGLVPPMKFIPFAEQTGYVRQLTLWLFEEACRQQAAITALGIQRLSINLSTRDLLDTELPEKLEALLQRHGARAEAFCLEITESAIMDDPQRAEGTLNRLSRRGYKLSIDDFGTGYSSLAYLKRLPVNELKIDKSFVMGMVAPAGEAGGDALGDTKIVRSTIDLAHNLGLSVVAEGVENADVLQRLADMGCDEAQGYHLGKPMPLADLQAWAARWRGQAPEGAAAPAGTPAGAPEAMRDKRETASSASLASSSAC